MQETVNPCDPLDERAAAGLPAPPSDASLVGEQVYLRDGRIAQVLSRTARGFVVELGYGEDGDFYFDGIELVTEVFLEQPTAAYASRVAELEKKAATLQEQVRTLESRVQFAEAVASQRMDFLKKFDGLEKIEQVMRGEVTHFVIPRYSGVEILAVNDARSTSESADIWNGKRYDKPLRMLQLFGNPKSHSAEWRLSGYSDGSDGHRGDVCFPCASEDEARAKAFELLNGMFAELMNKQGYMHGGNYLIDCAKKYSFPIPAGFIDRWDAHEAANVAKQIAEKQKELAALRAKHGVAA